ncbi:MAG: hypothetical protein KKF89_00355 [Nanoarchaeota archaeon]|nr:hypothetical protein [Patescibacteria group bacterium]MBU1854147.1 hypothetical protein [Nanoarchaeota archaeon]
MATFMDIGIIQHFSIVFVFLLIFALVYAIMEYTKLFGKDMKGIHAIIALALAILIVISKPAVAVLNVITPWFLVLFLFIFFIIFGVRMFGTSEADTISLIKDTRFYPYLIVIVIIIMIAGFASTYGQNLLEKGTGVEAEDGDSVVLPGDIPGGSTKTTSFGTNVLNTLIHPKVLGLIAILLIGLFTIIFLTKTS